MKIKKIILNIIGFVFAFITAFPVFYVVFASFMNSNTIVDAFQNYRFHLLPIPFTLQQYRSILFDYSGYLMRFWNSVILTFSGIGGQMVVAIFGAYAFAKINFPFKKQFFFFYILLMIMPSQVTLVPIYIIERKINLIGTDWAVILPMIFSTFGVFLLTQFMKFVPEEECEAAKVEGASHLRILFQIVLPQCKGAVASLFILGFADNWNMIEQPQILLNEDSMQPLSTFLSQVNAQQLNVACACGVIFMIPALLIYFRWEKELMTGIQYLNMK